MDGAAEGAYLELVGPGKAVQPPLGEDVGQGEGDGGIPLLVAAQGRLEEGKGAEVLAHGRGHIGGSAAEIKHGRYLGNGLFGYIHAGAFARRAHFAIGIPHAADRGNDTLNTGAGHLGDVVGGHTGTTFRSAYLNDGNLTVNYLDFF